MLSAVWPRLAPVRGRTGTGTSSLKFVNGLYICCLDCLNVNMKTKVGITERKRKYLISVVLNHVAVFVAVEMSLSD